MEIGFGSIVIVVYTANVLAAISTFYICVKNPPTVVCDFNRFLIAKK